VQGRVASPVNCRVAKLATTAAQAGDPRSKPVSRRTAPRILARHNRRRVPADGRSDRRAQCRIRHEMLELASCSYKQSDDGNRLSQDRLCSSVSGPPDAPSVAQMQHQSFILSCSGSACNRGDLSSVRYFSLPNGKRPMNATDGITFFAQRPTYCAVCAPCTISADVIEAVVALRNCGNEDWKIAMAPMVDGRPNPRECPHDEGRRHWFVTRVSG
jgi:hypothetical protein